MAAKEAESGEEKRVDGGRGGQIGEIGAPVPLSVENTTSPHFEGFTSS